MIVIEHHQAVMAHADWIIDLGPSAGHDGGRVVFEGTPADLIADRSTSFHSERETQNCAKCMNMPAALHRGDHATYREWKQP